MINLVQGVAVLLLTIISTVESQVVSFTSDLNGRFACPNETVVYSCSVNGTGISMSAVPFFNDVFGGTDRVSTTRFSSNARFILVEVTPFWTAQLQVLRVIATDVTCSDSLRSFEETLPLIVSSPPTSASNVLLTGLHGDTTVRSVRVTWDLPTSPQFDVAYYRVKMLVNDNISATGNSTSDMIVLQVPFNVQGTVEALVYTVSRCGEEAGPTRSVNSVSATYLDFYAAFLVPLLFIAILVGIIIGIIIGIRVYFYNCQKKKITNSVLKAETNEKEL